MMYFRLNGLFDHIKIHFRYNGAIKIQQSDLLVCVIGVKEMCNYFLSNNSYIILPKLHFPYVSSCVDSHS
jgi:hypothetical protein